MTQELETTTIGEQELDQTLADSFPASDPPPWTLGVRDGGPPSYVIDLSRPLVSGRVRKALVAGVLAAGVGLLFGLAVLVVGTPVALAARAIIEVVRWVASLL